MPKLNARNLKVTVVLDAVEVSGLPEPYTPRVVLHIQVADFGTVATDIASKSVRKVQNLITEHGVDAVAVIVQGRLVSGNKIAEAGLVGQVKAPKSVVQEATA